MHSRVDLRILQRYALTIVPRGYRLTTKRFIALGAMAAILATTACDSLNQALSSHKDVVARAAGYELSVDQTADLIAQNERLTPEPEIVDAVANLWVDYVLLANAAATDPTLGTVDVRPLVDPIIERQIFMRFNDEVIRPDTAISDEELMRLYQMQQPGAQIRARHILLSVAPDASAEDREKILARARDLRAQAIAGADFARLAEEHSEDPGTARQGGDLGFFSRGQMVAPFDEAAFALGIGEISEVVETPFGYHIIKLEERRGPTLGEIKDAFREQAKRTKMIQATEDYINNLTESLEVTVQPGALAVARELASKPNTNLTGRAASRVLVEYKGGELTAEEYLAVIRARTNPMTRMQLAEAPDADLENVLTSLAQNEILIETANREGITVPAAERDSIEADIRGQLALALGETGLASGELEEGESERDAVLRRVNAFLSGIIRGEEELLELGPVSYSLRSDRAGEIYERAYPEVVRKLQQIRSEPQTAAPDANGETAAAESADGAGVVEE